MKKIILLTLLSCQSLLTVSQGLSFSKIIKEEPIAKPWKSRIHYGGNIGIGVFGSFYFNASPMVGYDVTGKNTILGLGGNIYYQGFFQQAGPFAYGGRVFLRQAVFQQFFAQLDYEFMNANSYSFYENQTKNSVFNGSNKRMTSSSPIIGAGLYLGRNKSQGGTYAMLTYNLGYPSRGYIDPQRIGGGISPIALKYGFFF